MILKGSSQSASWLGDTASSSDDSGSGSGDAAGDGARFFARFAAFFDGSSTAPKRFTRSTRSASTNARTSSSE